MKGLLGMMGQFRKIQADLKEAMEELARAEFHGEAGAGKVKVVLSGRKELLSVDIDPSALDGKKTEGINRLVLEAVENAYTLAEAKRKEKLDAVVEGLPIPPGLLNF